MKRFALYGAISVAAFTIAAYAFSALPAHAQVTPPSRGGTGLSTAPTFGQVLVGQSNGTYALQATSTLGISAGSTFSTTSSDYWLTTKSTSGLAEGANLYWTAARGLASFIANLAATTSVQSIVSLPSLSLPYSQLTGAPVIPSKTSDLTNDSGFLTSYSETDPVFSASQAQHISAGDITHLSNLSGTNTGDQDLSGYALTSSLSTVATSGSYNDLSNKPTIPGTPTWGGIAGTLSDQADLQAALNGKVAVGTSSIGSITTLPSLSLPYSQVTGKPAIPTKTSDLTNDSGFLTSYSETDPVFSASDAADVTATDITHLSNLSGTNTGDQNLSGYALTSSLAAVALSGAYSDLTGKPTIPAFFAYPFPGNATTTKLMLSGGLATTYASTTAVSGTSLCISSDCRTSWPSGATWGSITGTLSSQSDLLAALDAKFGLSAWYATTTDGLAQGSVNKYWSNTLFDNRLSATTSLPQITTLAGLSLPYSQLTGTPTIPAFFAYPFPGDATSTELTLNSGLVLPSLGTPAGTFIAADPSGALIATSAPSGGGAAASSTLLSDDNTFSGINSFTTTATTSFAGPVAFGNQNSSNGVTSFFSNTGAWFHLANTGDSFLTLSSGNDPGSNEIAKFATNSAVFDKGVSITTTGTTNTSAGTLRVDGNSIGAINLINGTITTKTTLNATNPPYSFIGDTNTGMGQFSVGADTLSFATAGAIRATFTPSGGLGLGTTTGLGLLTLATDADNNVHEPLTNTGDEANFPLVLKNLNAVNASSTGVAFKVTNTSVNNGAAIIFKRTGSNSLGELQFWNKQNTTGGGALTQAMTLSDNGNVGVGTTSPFAKLSVVGPVVAEYFNATSTTAKSVFAGATPQEKVEKSFSYSTSTAWTGTTTIPIGPAYTAQRWIGAKCFTDVGTLGISFNDGSNRMNYIPTASTTVNEILFTTNNTFTSSEKRYVDIGTPVSSPTKIACTVTYEQND
jgi:hypothetical protein